MTTVKAMTIVVDSLLPRPKLDCDVGYDAAVKGVSVVVLILQVVFGTLRYKCRGSRQPWHSIHSMYKGRQVQEVEVADTPVLLQLLAHSLPILILAKA